MAAEKLDSLCQFTIAFLVTKHCIGPHNLLICIFYDILLNHYMYKKDKGTFEMP